jgi:hypothetical protein
MNLDLDINNYNYSELQSLLKLKPPYLINDVDENVTIFRERIFKTHDLDTNNKNSVLQFLENVKNRLLETLSSPVKEEKMIPVKVEQTGHNVIITKPIPHVSEIINPISRRIINKVLNIDTKFRQNYYTTSATDILINLPTTIEKVISVELVSFEFPNSYFLIGKAYNNNHFVIRLYDVLTLVVKFESVIIVPDGNYTRNELQTEINMRLTAALVGFVPVPAWFQNIEFAIDAKSGRCILSLLSIPGSVIPGLAGFKLIFNETDTLQNDVTPIQFKLGWLLGFREAEYNFQTASAPPLPTWSQCAFVTEGIYDPTRIRYVYVVVDDFNSSVNNYFMGAFNDSILNPNILAKITLPTDTISINNRAYKSGWKRDYFGPVRIQKMHLQILDEYGRIIDINNMDYSISLRFEIMYDN